MKTAIQHLFSRCKKSSDTDEARLIINAINTQELLDEGIPEHSLSFKPLQFLIKSNYEQFYREAFKIVEEEFAVLALFVFKNFFLESLDNKKVPVLLSKKTIYEKFRKSIKEQIDLGILLNDSLFREHEEYDVQGSPDKRFVQILNLFCGISELNFEDVRTPQNLKTVRLYLLLPQMPLHNNLQERMDFLCSIIALATFFRQTFITANGTFLQPDVYEGYKSNPNLRSNHPDYITDLVAVMKNVKAPQKIQKSWDELLNILSDDLIGIESSGIKGLKNRWLKFIKKRTETIQTGRLKPLTLDVDDQRDFGKVVEDAYAIHRLISVLVNLENYPADDKQIVLEKIIEIFKNTKSVTYINDIFELYLYNTLFRHKAEIKFLESQKGKNGEKKKTCDFKLGKEICFDSKCLVPTKFQFGGVRNKLQDEIIPQIESTLGWKNCQIMGSAIGIKDTGEEIFKPFREFVKREADSNTKMLSRYEMITFIIRFYSEMTKDIKKGDCIKFVLLYYLPSVKFTERELLKLNTKSEDTRYESFLIFTTRDCTEDDYTIIRKEFKNIVPMIFKFKPKDTKEERTLKRVYDKREI
jgi:hypothetical protein